MFCVKCGNPVDLNSKFCTNCGAEIKTEVQNSNKENQTSVNNNSNNNNSKNNKGIKVGLIIFISVIVASVILFVIFFSKFIHNITKKVMINENIQSDIEKATDDLISGIHDEFNDKTNTAVNEKKIGNNEFGYLKVKDNWYKYYDVDAPQVLEYTLDGNWIICMYAQDSSKLDAKTYAQNVGAKMKEEGATGVTGATVKVGPYTAYQVYGYYTSHNKWVVAWCFEPGDGKSHYISIEGTDRYNSNYNIVDTFTLN